MFNVFLVLEVDYSDVFKQKFVIYENSGASQGYMNLAQYQKGALACPISLAEKEEVP